MSQCRRSSREASGSRRGRRFRTGWIMGEDCPHSLLPSRSPRPQKQWQFSGNSHPGPCIFRPPAPEDPTSAPFRPPGHQSLTGEEWEPWPTKDAHKAFQGVQIARRERFWGLVRTEPVPKAIVGGHRAPRGLTASPVLPVSPPAHQPLPADRASDAGGPGGLGGHQNDPISGKVPARISAILCIPVRLSALWPFGTIRSWARKSPETGSFGASALMGYFLPAAASIR